MTWLSRSRIDWPIGAVATVVLGLWASALVQYRPLGGLREALRIDSTQNIVWVGDHMANTGILVLVAGAAGLGAATAARRLVAYAALGCCVASAAVGVLIVIVQVAIDARGELMALGLATTASVVIAGVALVVVLRLPAGSAAAGAVGLAGAMVGWLIRYGVNTGLYLHSIHRYSLPVDTGDEVRRIVVGTALTVLLLLAVWCVGSSARAAVAAGAVILGLMAVRDLVDIVRPGLDTSLPLPWTTIDALQLAGFVAATVFAALATAALPSRPSEHPQVVVS